MTRNGFTLVELLVALLIFGLLSAAATALLSFGVEARARSAARLDAVAALVRTRSLLTADLAQAAPRSYRREDGTVAPAFAAGEPLLAFVRRGWTNEDGQARASLQRLEYHLRDGRLERVAYPMVDGAKPFMTAVLLEDVRSVRLRYRVAGQWRDHWDAVRPDALPQAVELTLEQVGGPASRQLFLVGAS